ncbi:MAG: hypothetical protein RL885_13180 [Planctomycetota bacterium]
MTERCQVHSYQLKELDKRLLRLDSSIASVASIGERSQEIGILGQLGERVVSLQSQLLELESRLAKLPGLFEETLRESRRQVDLHTAPGAAVASGVVLKDLAPLDNERLEDMFFALPAPSVYWQLGKPDDSKRVAGHLQWTYQLPGRGRVHFWFDSGVVVQAFFEED